MGASLLRIEDVARELAVHPKTVRRLIATGQLTAVRIGAAIRVTPDDVGAFVNGHRTAAGSPAVEAPLRRKQRRLSSGAYAERLRSLQREHSS